MYIYTFIKLSIFTNEYSLKSRHCVIVVSSGCGRAAGDAESGYSDDGADSRGPPRPDASLLLLH